MKTAIRHLKISSARFYNFAFFLLTFYFLKLINQFESIMQNKANLPNALMNVNKVLTRDYEKRTLGEHGENKPNQTQSKPIQSQYKANTKPICRTSAECPNSCKLSKNKEL